MERDQVSKLNGYQSLALAVLVSTLTALAVLLLLRLHSAPVVTNSPGNAGGGGQDEANQSPDQPAAGAASAAQSQPAAGGGPAGGESSSQPAIGTVQEPAEVPRHFTEDIVLPGFTQTGPEIAKQDVEEGRSPDGV